jgi:uncharacterized protein (DUF1800 family)
MGAGKMRAILAAIALIALAACGGGGGGGGGGPPGPTPTAAPTAAEAARLLTQGTFGPTEASINEVRTSSLSSWIDRQFALPLAGQSHQAFLEARLAQLRVANPTASLSANQFYESWWKQAATEPDQLRQRVAFALSQIMVISLADGAIDVRGASSYYDTLTRNAFGNFRTLLEDVTLHPQMGIYLTYRGNQREDPNGTRTPDENYAREVMQLFTIGLWELNQDGTVRTNAQGQQIPTYTTQDIAGLARVFTGWSWYHPAPTNSTFFGGSADPDRHVRPMIGYPNYFSLSQKSFLGTTIPALTGATTEAVMRQHLATALDTLFNHPNVGPFISQRLIQQLVTSNPSPAYVGRVAAVFNNNGQGTRGDMRAVIRQILLDPEARDMNATSSATFGKLKEPVLRMTAWMRAFGAASQSGNWLITSTSANTSLSQSPLASPSVFNFWRPGFVPPSATELGAQSLLSPEFQSVDEVTVAGYLNTIQTTIDQGIGSTPPGGSGRDVRTAYAAELAVADDPAALVSRMNTLLLADQMSAGLRTRVTDAVTAIAIPGGTATQTQIDAARLNRVKTAALFVMASPEFLIQR